jgi:hypothetical protein
VAECFAPLLENANIGGASPIALKKLYGAGLTDPSAAIVETHPIGRRRHQRLERVVRQDCPIVISRLVEDHPPANASVSAEVWPWAAQLRLGWRYRTSDPT